MAFFYKAKHEDMENVGDATPNWRCDPRSPYGHPYTLPAPSISIQIRVAFFSSLWTPPDS